MSAARDDNPAAPPESRYKALGRGRGGLLAFQSPDCQRWQQIQDKPVITHGAFDSQNLAFWDAERQEYRAYWRYFGNGVRAIRTATSRDFLTWTSEADLTYDEGTPREHLYTNAIQPYFRAPQLFIGFPTRFEPQSQQVEPIFMTSRDGRRFHRWADPVIPRTAPRDRNHNRSNYMAWGMVRLPDRPDAISVYATENYYEQTPGRLRRFEYRVDGFVALRGGAAGGRVTTKPLSVSGTQLLINYAVADDGLLTLEVINDAGTVIGISQPLTGDSVNHAVRWRVAPSFDQGRVRLRMTLRSADVFSIRSE